MFMCVFRFASLHLIRSIVNVRQLRMLLRYHSIAPLSFHLWFTCWLGKFNTSACCYAKFPYLGPCPYGQSCPCERNRCGISSIPMSRTIETFKVCGYTPSRNSLGPTSTFRLRSCRYGLGLFQAHKALYIYYRDVSSLQRVSC